MPTKPANPAINPNPDIESEPVIEAMPTGVGAVLLAAGEGSRMGGLPKCLISIDGQPLLSRSLAALKAAGITRTVVVTGNYAERIEPLVDPAQAHIIRNPAPERGQGSSVRLGLEALISAGLCEAVIIALADQPLVGQPEFATLLTAFRQRPPGCSAVYPAVDGQRGNPVVLEGALVARLVAAGKAGAVRQYIDQHPAQVHVLDSANPAFVTDLDTRDDVAAFEARTASRLTLPPPA